MTTKKEFEKWCLDKDPETFHYSENELQVLGLSFYKAPMSIRWGVYVEYFATKNLQLILDPYLLEIEVYHNSIEVLNLQFSGVDEFEMNQILAVKRSFEMLEA